MPVRIDLSSNASVRMIRVNEDDTACAYLANLYIPIFSLDNGKIIRRFKVPNQIAGIHFSYNKKSVFYAVDDSFGLHIFDIRTDSKRKHRLNPESENHNVVCTAFSSNSNTMAVASSEFGGGILDVRGSRPHEHHTHVFSLYDVRYPSDPITSYYKRHNAGVNSMEFYLNGNYLITGDTSGAIKSFDTLYLDEDIAIRWERWAKGPISKVGVFTKGVVYGISDRSEASVFVDTKGDLEVLCGRVNNEPDEPIVKTSKAFYKKPEWCLGLIKGVNDDIPLVAVHGVENKKFISLTAMNQEGVRQEKPMLTYKGHTQMYDCHPESSLTGGEDGKVIIQIANFKNPKFGEDNIDHHRLTLNRGNLVELEDNGGAKSDDEHNERKSEENSDDSDSNDGTQPSTATAASKPKQEKKEKKDGKDKKDKKEKQDQPSTSSQPSTFAAAVSSSSTPSSSKQETKEERKARKEKEAKERVRAEKKAEQEKEARKEKEAKKEGGKKTEDNKKNTHPSYSKMIQMFFSASENEGKGSNQNSIQKWILKSWPTTEESVCARCVGNEVRKELNNGKLYSSQKN